MQEWAKAVHEAWGGRSPYVELLLGLGCIVSVHVLLGCRALLERWRWRRFLARAREEAVD